MGTYKQILSILFEARRSCSQRSLKNMIQLSQSFSHPQKAYPTIHIAGTNGKGSVATKIAKALELNGYKVGLYTSPHLFIFRERISINGNMISEQDVVEEAKCILFHAEQAQIKASFFEITTMMAFNYFRKQEIDVAVIETGLGGQFDATNIVSPIVSVITSISKEHTNILGEELEQIAGEKAGIIKKGSALVLGPKANFSSIYEKAKSLHCPVLQVRDEPLFSDEENSLIAKEALNILSLPFKLSKESIENGLRSLPSCRFELCESFLFDVAHNPDAFDRLFKSIKHFYPEKKLCAIIGMSSDKDVFSSLQIAKDYVEHFFFVQADQEKAFSLDRFKKLAQLLNIPSYFLCKTIEEAINLAGNYKIHLKIVCGSFYIMQRAKEALSNHS